MTCPRCNAPAEERTLREFGGVCPKCLLAFSEEQDAPAFPNLEIVEMIGQGGMGVVYKARQKNLDRLVALKVLSPQLSDDPEFVERFTREAKALAQLNHPNIVGIYDSGIHDHVPYLVMEFIDGTPLRQVLASGKLTPARALEVIPQVCDALQYAHAHGVVHRDIKPENILIDRQGRVKIADFGLAKLSRAEESQITQPGFVMGTPRYMAPEQFEPSRPVDHRADIYSLGVVFYEMLTGEVPMGRFKPPSAKADVDRRLDPVVLKSLEREPEDRYQSADEVKEHVAGLKSERPGIPARPAHPRFRAGCFLVLAIAAAFLIFAVLLFLFLMIPRRAPAPQVAPSTPWGAGRFRPRTTGPGESMSVGRHFDLEKVWPAASEIPPGSSPGKECVGAEALRQAGLPEAMLPDLMTVRSIRFDQGRALLIGWQFANEVARRRWARDKELADLLAPWSYRLAGESNSWVFLGNDGSNPGIAIAETLWPVIRMKQQKVR